MAHSLPYAGPVQHNSDSSWRAAESANRRVRRVPGGCQTGASGVVELMVKGMEMSNKRIAALVILGLAVGAQADTITIDGNGSSTGNFNVAVNWNPDVVPDAGDRIVIPDDKTCNVNVDSEADTVEIEGNGILVIKNGVTLTLDNDDHNFHTCPFPAPTCSFVDNSIIDGELIITGDTGGGDAVLKLINATHVFSGNGRIVGNKGQDLSHIEIATDIKLVNRLAGNGDGIIGGMTITGLTGGTNRGILRKEGNVHAAAYVVFGDDDEIVIDADIEDTSDAVWSTDCEAIMEFKYGSTALQGLFSDKRVSQPGGIFKFNADVRTCGDYERGGCGGIDVENSASFKYAGFTGSCDNPDTDGPSEDTPNNCSETDEFYEVDFDVSEDCE